MCIDQYSTLAYADLRVKPLCHSSLCLKHIMFITIIPMQSAHTCTHTHSHTYVHCTWHNTHHTTVVCVYTTYTYACMHAQAHIDTMHTCTHTYTHLISNFTRIQRIIVSFTFCVLVNMRWILPSLHYRHTNIVQLFSTQQHNNIYKYSMCVNHTWGRAP